MYVSTYLVNPFYATIDEFLFEAKKKWTHSFGFKLVWVGVEHEHMWTKMIMYNACIGIFKVTFLTNKCLI